MMEDLKNHVASFAYPGPTLPTPNHIRLVSIQPGTDKIITCEIITAEIHSVLSYEALSYTWGDPHDRQTVLIKAPGDEQLKEFLVTSNCVSALHRLRYKDRPRILWIDALGIDQSNLVERNHQVALMSEIYSKAINVVIYLGEAAGDSDMAVDFIMECESPSSDTTSLSYPKSTLLIQALNNFFRRPWFTRVWVIQEVVLSNAGVAYCGSKTLHWSAIKHFNSWNTVNKWLEKLPFVVSTPKTVLAERHEKLLMLKTLVQARHCEATDPRDKIYSMLPLLGSSDEHFGLTPRYEDPVAKVYTDCASALIADSGYDVFSVVQGGSTIADLPSWVPDWSVKPKREVLVTFSRIRMNSFWNFEKLVDAPKTPQLIVRETTSLSTTKSSRRLCVAGYLCGRILKMGSPYLAGQGIFPWKEWRSLSQDEAVVGRYKTKDVPLNHDSRSPDDFIFHSVIGAAGFAYASAIAFFVKVEEEHGEDGTREGYDNSWLHGNASELSWDNNVSQMAANRHNIQPSGGFALPFTEIPFHLAGKYLPPSYEAYVQFVLKHCHSRRFFITDTGYMGIGPEEAEIGDCIYICVGAAIPFAFRNVQETSHDQGAAQFQLVGECYTEKRAWVELKDRSDSPQYFDVV